MTRKHFEAIAMALGHIENSEDRQSTAKLIASVCKQSNSRFDRERFLDAVEKSARSLVR
jgi:triphosphoribosyl-dephospho-CoA synthetase